MAGNTTESYGNLLGNFRSLQKLAHEPGDNGAEHQGEAKIRLCQNNNLHCVKDFLARLAVTLR